MPCGLRRAFRKGMCLSAASAAASAAVVVIEAASEDAVVEADAVSAACKDKDKDNYPPAAVISEHEISPREI